MMSKCKVSFSQSPLCDKNKNGSVKGCRSCLPSFHYNSSGQVMGKSTYLFFTILSFEFYICFFELYFKALYPTK